MAGEGKGARNRRQIWRARSPRGAEYSPCCALRALPQTVWNCRCATSSCGAVCSDPRAALTPLHERWAEGAAPAAIVAQRTRTVQRSIASGQVRDPISVMIETRTIFSFRFQLRRARKTHAQARCVSSDSFGSRDLARWAVAAPRRRARRAAAVAAPRRGARREAGRDLTATRVRTAIAGAAARPETARAAPFAATARHHAATATAAPGAAAAAAAAAPTAAIVVAARLGVASGAAAAAPGVAALLLASRGRPSQSFLRWEQCTKPRC